MSENIVDEIAIIAPFMFEKNEMVQVNLLGGLHTSDALDTESWPVGSDGCVAAPARLVAYSVEGFTGIESEIFDDPEIKEKIITDIEKRRDKGIFDAPFVVTPFAILIRIKYMTVEYWEGSTEYDIEYEYLGPLDMAKLSAETEKVSA